MQRNFLMLQTHGLPAVEPSLRNGACLGIALEWLMSILQGRPWESPADGFWQAIAQHRAYLMAHDTNTFRAGVPQEYEALTWRYVSRTAYHSGLAYRRLWVQDSRQLVSRITEAANDGSGIMFLVYCEDLRQRGVLRGHALGFAVGPDGGFRFCDPADSQWSWPASSEATDVAMEVTQYIEQRTPVPGEVIRMILLYKFGGRALNEELRAYYDRSAAIMPIPAVPTYRASYPPVAGSRRSRS